MPDTIIDLSLPEEEGLTLLPDGSTEVDLDPAAPQREQREVDKDNLACSMDENELTGLGQKLVELVEADIESRQAWHELMRAGLRKIGIIDQGSGDGGKKEDLEGRSVAIHPLIIEAAVQFQARAIEEMWPSSGPVKAMVVGESDEELEEQASRVEAHMNWQCLEEDEELFEEKDRMMFILPFAGCVFTKTWYDQDCDYVTTKLVLADDLIMPYRAKSLRRAPRVTHRFPLSWDGLLRYQKSGFYRDVDVQDPAVQESGSQSLADQADRKSPSGDELDQEYTIYEVHCDWDLDSGINLAKNIAQPYIMTVERDSMKVLAIRRNESPRKEGTRRTWFVQHNYLPGFGVYGFGLFHVIGGLQDSATGLLRAALDSASFANWQGGFTSKEVTLNNQGVKLKPGVWQATEMTAEELKNGFYTPPFKDASPALFHVLNLVVEAGQRFASTTDAMVGEGAKNIPVGTTVARIEQGLKVYSAIHKRLHRSQRAEFKLRAELNFEYLSERGLTYQTAGQNMQILKEDYDDRIDVVPVSDPNIVSTTQRIAVAQAVVERAAVNPLYDKYEAEHFLLRALKVPDPDKLLPKQDERQPCDAVTEGSKAMMGEALKAFPEQAHQAHIQVHLGQLELTKGTPVEPVATPLLLAHINEHYAMQYRLEIIQVSGMQLPLMGEEMEIPPEMDEMIAAAALEATQKILAERPNPEAQQANADMQLAQAKVEQAQVGIQKATIDVERATIERDKAAGENDLIRKQFELASKEMNAEMQAKLGELEAAHRAELEALQRKADETVAAEHKRADDAIAEADTSLVKAEIDKQAKLGVADTQAQVARDTKIADLIRQMDALKEELKREKAEAKRQADEAKAREKDIKDQVAKDKEEAREKEKAEKEKAKPKKRAIKLKGKTYDIESSDDGNVSVTIRDDKEKK